MRKRSKLGVMLVVMRNVLLVKRVFFPVKSPMFTRLGPQLLGHNFVYSVRNRKRKMYIRLQDLHTKYKESAPELSLMQFQHL